MIKDRALAFVFPTLGEASCQNEDIVQLLLFVSHYLEQRLEQGLSPEKVTFIVADGDSSGWLKLASILPQSYQASIQLQSLDTPITPNLSVGNHKPAYDLFEFLKDHTFEQVHFLDYSGLAYYATQAKQLGLHFLDTTG